MRSGEACSSLNVRLPWSMSRTTRSDHLSPTTSSVLAMGQGERANPCARVVLVFTGGLRYQSLAYCN